MKKIVFVFLFLFVFGASYTSAQKYITSKSSNVLVDKMPYPDTSYYGNFFTLKMHYKQFIPENCDVDCIFLDSIDNSIFELKEYDNIKFNRFMVLGYKKNEIRPNWHLKDFNKFKGIKTDTLKYNYYKDIDTTDFIIGLKKSKLKLNKFNVIKNLCKVYDLDTAFGILSYKLEGTETKSAIKLCITSYIKIKKKGIITMVFATYNRKEDLIWLKETSESWSKAIIEINRIYNFD